MSGLMQLPTLDGDTASSIVAEAIYDLEREWGVSPFEVVGYGTGGLAATLRDTRDGSLYDIRAERRA